MRLGELKNIIEGTAEPAFVLDANGHVVAWNRSARETFGVNEADAVGLHCSDLLHGIDECGKRCSHDCSIQKQALRNVPLKSYDIQLSADGERRWFSMVVTAVGDGQAQASYTIHIAKPIDVQKRFELVLRDLIMKETDLSAAGASKLLAAERSPSGFTELTKRELEVLKLIAEGKTTAAIADRLFISKTTVNNHVRHILKKLNANSRLEAVRRAEQARLI